MPNLRVNDINVHYEIQGEGPPLVLIPGLGADISEYGSILRGLVPFSRVIAADNRGAGRTDKPDIPYSVEMMAVPHGDRPGASPRLVHAPSPMHRRYA
jgi:pimeloyl-ACP methyl ester carboxylesterase